MADRILSGPVEGACRETGINIHTTRIMDACRDKDCVEDLRVYPTVGSRAVIDSAFSVRPVSAALLSADVNVDEISFNRGYYTVDVTYFYLVTGETFPGGVPVRGLAVFDKRVILYGSEGSVKTFSSAHRNRCGAAGPIAVVDAVDPIALNLRIAEPAAPAETELRTIPDGIVEAIGEDLDLAASGRRLYVTLGQFSVIRLEREYLLTLEDAKHFLPNRECVGSSDDDPCTLFSRVGFPVDEFIPPETMPREENYRDLVSGK